jgi:hypothetical protein
MPFAYPDPGFGVLTPENFFAIFDASTFDVGLAAHALYSFDANICSR